MLVLTLRDTAKSLYRFSQTTDGQQKKNETHHFISGILKTGAIFATYASMYAAFYLIKRPLFQVVLDGLTFCVHPLATLDAIGTASCISGVFKIVISLSMAIENRKVTNKIFEQVKSQAKAEGYRFYNFPESLIFGAFNPPETFKRCIELTSDIVRKSSFDRDQWITAKEKALGHFIQGWSLLMVSALSALGASWTIHVPQIFWLDRKLESCSRWLASCVV